MPQYFSGGNTIPGAQLASTIRDMAALGRIGHDVLEQFGIREIDPQQRYSFRIRRSIHETVLRRFGPDALYSFGFAYGDSWLHIHDAATRLRAELSDNERSPRGLRTKDAIDQLVGISFQLMREILERNSRDDLNYGASFEHLGGLRYRATMTNTSSPNQEAFPRGLFENFLYRYLSDHWRFTVCFLPDETTHGDEWTRFVWTIEFSPTQSDRPAEELAWVQRHAAREALLGQVLAESEHKHRLVMESINYARLLQQAQLPRPAQYRALAKDVGVLWEPRDTIGGDLWWMNASPSARQFTLVIVDCAGHGVPGAMLALLASASLESLYAADPALLPAAALQRLGNALRRGLNQDRALQPGETAHDDGCDAAALLVDLDAGIALFAGANLGLLHLPGGAEPVRIRGDAVRLGYRDALDAIPAQHSLHFASGDRFVMTTDGVTDQVGAEGGRTMAFGHRRLAAFVDARRELPAQALMEALGTELRRWQGDGLRRDDVTAICLDV